MKIKELAFVGHAAADLQRAVLTICVAILCNAGILRAEKQVEVEWTLISSTEPLYDMAMPSPVKSPGMPENAGIVSLVAAKPKEELAAELQRMKAVTWSPPKVKCATGKEGRVRNLIKIPALTLEGDFAKYGVERPEVDSDELSDLGYEFVCRPKIGAEENAVELEFEVKIIRLEGFQETLLTGQLPEAMKRDQSLISAADFPRIRSPILARNEVTTSTTVYDGQSIVLSSPFKKESWTPTQYVMITVKIVDSK